MREAKKGAGDNVPSLGFGDEIPNVSHARSAKEKNLTGAESRKPQEAPEPFLASRQATDSTKSVGRSQRRVGRWSSGSLALRAGFKLCFLLDP